MASEDVEGTKSADINAFSEGTVAGAVAAASMRVVWKFKTFCQ